MGLQDNAIDTLASDDGSGLEELVNLQTLCLAKNRIQSIEEFQVCHCISLFLVGKCSYCVVISAIKSQHLRKLISIHALSFADDHFGTNPLVNHPDYRSYAIATLKHVRSIRSLCSTDSSAS